MSTVAETTSGPPAPEPDNIGWIFDSLPGPMTVDEPLPLDDDGPRLDDARWSERVQPRRAVAEVFPLHVFPDWMTDWSRSIAVETQSPVEMATSFGLVALSVVCAGRIDARVGPNRTEGLNLFLIVVLRPGSAKTPVMNAMLEPIKRWEEQLRQDAVREMARRKQERKVLERQLAASDKSLEAVSNKLDEARKELEAHNVVAKDLASGGAEMRTELEAAEATSAELRAKVTELESAKEQAMSKATETAVQLAQVALAYPRLLTDDVTPEALFRLMCENRGRIAVISDEAAGTFAHMGGRYSGESNTNVYTQAWSNNALRGDREGDKRDNEPTAGRYTGRSWLTMGLATQVKVFADAMAKSDFRDRGVMDRFLLVKPDVPPGYKDHVEGFRASREDSSRRAREAYLQRFEMLITSMPDSLDEIDIPEEIGLRIAEWMNEVELRQRPGGELEGIVGWAQKGNGNCVRLTGLLHVAATFDSDEGWRQPVSIETVERAIELMEWYLHELARNTSDLVDRDQLLGAVHEVLTRIKTCNPKYLEGGHTITIGNLTKYCGLPREDENSELRYVVVETLKANDWLRPVHDPVQKRGGKTQRFVIHPQLRP